MFGTERTSIDIRHVTGNDKPGYLVGVGCPKTGMYRCPVESDRCWHSLRFPSPVIFALILLFTTRTSVPLWTRSNLRQGYCLVSQTLFLQARASIGHTDWALARNEMGDSEYTLIISSRYSSNPSKLSRGWHEGDKYRGASPWLGDKNTQPIYLKRQGFA